MNSIYSKSVCVFLLMFASAVAQAQTATASLHGRVTDPSASSVPNALVVLKAPGAAELRRTTDLQGQYSFAKIPAGKYTVTVTRQGFSPAQMEDYEITGNATLDFPLSVAVEAEKITVQDQIGKQVSVDPDSNAGALVLSGKDLDTLSDDPDQLQEDLQALAGPSAGPNGGQIYIDGFTGGRLPPKSSIREVRLNQNPFSAEYDRLGFGRIEIFTKPGTDKYRGQFMSMFSDDVFNARNPFVLERPPFQARIFAGSLSGPINKRASFSFDAEHRGIDEYAAVNATVLDPTTFADSSFRTSVPTPQDRWQVVPRVDIQLTPKNTLVARYTWSRINQDQGVGTLSLPTLLYPTGDSENSIQLTETAVLSANMINETRFQYRHDSVFEHGDNTLPQISVGGAFTGGGSQVGRAENQENHWEVQNFTSRTSGRHSWKFGGRLRTTTVRDVSPQNYGGSFTFSGGMFPVLTAGNQIQLDQDGQPVMQDLKSIDQYRITTMLLAQGLTPAQVNALGYGASQFQIAGGNPLASLNQTDVGVFLTDDWRARPNLTLSYGLRYENQTNIDDWKNLAPRIGVAWGIGGGAKRQPKTVLRAGAGIFYDRIDDTLTLQALRYNGVNTQQYIIDNPDFYPNVPSITSLAAAADPLAIRSKAANLRAPYVIQAAVGIERQLPHNSTIATTYTFSRGVHMLRTRNINAPTADGVYPYATQGAIYEYESSGTMRQNQLITNFNTRFSRYISLFGFYMLNSAKSDTDGAATFPASTYDLATEWGSSSFDVRHRVFTGGSVTAPWKLMFSPFIAASSGQPFNIVTGTDLNGDGIFNDRPSFCTSGPNCIATAWGNLDKSPTAGEQIIPRNYGRGPGQFSFNLRLARTFGFGKKTESASGMGGPGGPGGFMAGGGPRGGGRRGGPGGPGGMFGGESSGRRYSLTLGIMARNLFNVV
ncbi:MAG TPA: carboxypeptidase regulatory-like domain-containing protein, partial [Bryobacteraceae bacterium]|nr:carboxypeptidase regulatory-like domain-containing protein [Bryobacteraceae bacterium]